MATWWHWHWVFKAKYLNGCVSGIVFDWQETKVIWVEAMLDPLDDLDLWHTYDLDLGFSRSNFPTVLFQEEVVCLAWNEGIRIQLIWCCRYYFKINSWWLIMMSSTHGPAANYCDITMAHCSHGYLWTHDVEVGASWRDCDNLFVYFTYHFRTR